MYNNLNNKNNNNWGKLLNYYSNISQNIENEEKDLKFTLNLKNKKDLLNQIYFKKNLEKNYKYIETNKEKNQINRFENHIKERENLEKLRNKNLELNYMSNNLELIKLRKKINNSNKINNNSIKLENKFIKDENLIKLNLKNLERKYQNDNYELIQKSQERNQTFKNKELPLIDIFFDNQKRRKDYYKNYEKGINSCRMNYKTNFKNNELEEDKDSNDSLIFNRIKDKNKKSKLKKIQNLLDEIKVI